MLSLPVLFQTTLATPTLTPVSPLRPLCSDLSALCVALLRCICKLRVLNSLQPLLSLFATPKKVNSFGINQIQPLFPKHPGWGGYVRGFHGSRVTDHGSRVTSPRSAANLAACAGSLRAKRSASENSTQ